MKISEFFCGVNFKFHAWTYNLLTEKYVFAQNVCNFFQIFFLNRKNFTRQKKFNEKILWLNGGKTKMMMNLIIK